MNPRERILAASTSPARTAARSTTTSSRRDLAPRPEAAGPGRALPDDFGNEAVKGNAATFARGG